MIEQSVSLASNGVVKVPGYEQLVRFGYTKNRGVYRLHVDATGEWEGLAIRAFWHVPDGKDPVSALVADGYVAVPASVTAQPGNGCITFEGSDGTKTVTSADLRYRVSANSGTEDGTEPEPGTPAWQQLVDAVHTDAAAAEQAKTDAQTAAQQSEASAQKAGRALSDTITAKEDALKVIGDKQNAATQAVDTVRDKALKQVEASTKAAQTAASEAATSADKAAGSEKAAGDAQAKAAESLQELKEGIASGNFKGEPGTSPTVTVQDITGGHRIVITDATGTSSVDVMDGKDGAPGKDATVDDTLSQSGKAADAKVTGDALATKAVIDDTAVGTDAWSSKHLVDMLCPPISETGNPVACYPVSGYPLGVTASWEPTQEGSGDPSPENARPIKGRDSVTVERCGENLLNFPIEKESGGISVTTEPDGRYHLKGTLNQDGFSCSIGVAHLPAGTYTVNRASISTPLSANAIVITLRKITPTGSVAWIETSTGVTQNTGILAKPTDISIAFYGAIASIKKGAVIDTHFELMLVPGTTAPTTYAPYTGQTATLTLPRTIYGGTVDAVTGEGQETWKLVTLDGTEEWETWGVNKNNAAVTGFYTYSINDYDPNGNKLLCSTMPYNKNVDVWGGRNEGIGYSNALNQGSRYMIYSVKTDTLSDTSDNASAVASFKSYLAAQYAAGTPVQIAYKLATSTPFTATGAQPISALSGVNTALTDADSVTVTGRADPIKRITDLEDAVASMTNT